MGQACLLENEKRENTSGEKLDHGHVIQRQKDRPWTSGFSQISWLKVGFLPDNILMLNGKVPSAFLYTFPKIFSPGHWFLLSDTYF